MLRFFSLKLVYIELKHPIASKAAKSHLSQLNKPGRSYKHITHIFTFLIMPK